MVHYVPYVKDIAYKTERDVLQLPSTTSTNSMSLMVHNATLMGSIVTKENVMTTTVGRPSRQALEQTKELTKREQANALKEFRKRLLLNPKSPKLIEKLFETAFDDDHKNQAVCMKLLADRLLPVAGFTADGKQQASVSINITGLGDSAGVTIDGSSGEIEEDLV